MKKILVMCGPNVIESEEHTTSMARKLKSLFAHYNVDFVFKVSFDKANRSSLNSYRGPGFEEGIQILRNIKNNVGVKIITDIHESWQAKEIAEVADIIQIPAFLCRQTDLLKAAAETGKIIHVKKGQMCSAEQMHKCKEKLIAFGNSNVILCERGNSFGYQDLVVDPRNLIWLKSETNKVSMDITHCLQQPSQKMADGTVKSGGFRELIPYMGKVAMALDIDGLFLEVHDEPDKALCDGPTQWPLDKLEWLLGYLGLEKNKNICVLCRKKLTDWTLIYKGDIRGDKTNSCSIVKCSNCGHIQLVGYRENLKEHYDEDSQSNDIVNFFNITKSDIINKEKVEISRRIKYLELENEKQYKIMDVGSGYLTFGKSISEKKNVSVTCIEPSVKRTDIGRKINSITSTDNIIIKNIFLDDEYANNNKEAYDIITSWHVFEHLPENTIDKLLQNMYKCCKKGGKIFIEVPNGNDELLKIDKYKRINYMIHHISYWTEETLSKLLNNNKINNYHVKFVQRYGIKNYLNWIYNLGEKQDLDMNDDNSNKDWLHGKAKAKNTDALLVVIQK